VEDICGVKSFVHEITRKSMKGRKDELSAKKMHLVDKDLGCRIGTGEDNFPVLVFFRIR